MAKITNHARGPRGISLKDGTTIWLDPGQSEDIKKDDIAGPLPDLGTAPAAASSEGSDDRVSALFVEIDRLKAQHSGDIAALREESQKVLAAEKQRADDAEKLLAEASAEIDSLKAQVAKFDADGDGKTGGSKAEAKK